VRVRWIGRRVLLHVIVTATRARLVTIGRIRINSGT
jgi:hypothetical protein